jgi:hypothetical protein
MGGILLSIPKLFIIVINANQDLNFNALILNIKRDAERRDDGNLENIKFQSIKVVDVESFVL